MIEVGKYNTLKVVKDLDFGLYLDGGEELGEILLPRRYVPPTCTVDSEIEVFIYLDSEDRLIATTEMPTAIVGEFAYLKALEVTKVGAFMDWGLPKDLLVPFREQKVKIEKGKSYIVFLYLDDISGRIAASSKIEKYLDNIPPEYSVGEQVDLIISGESDLGYKAIINNTHSGIIYFNQTFKKLAKGEKIKGYISKIRDDEKIDLLLEKPGYAKIDDISSRILEVLKKQDGFLNLNDKSDAEDVKNILGISKKSFKKAIGTLYKQRIIEIGDRGIFLLKK